MNLKYQELGRLLADISKLTDEEIIELINKSQEFKNNTITTLQRISKLIK